MEPIFLTAVLINKVRHLKNIRIPLSSDERKHLIFTGKNGSGKTSVLDALAEHLKYVVSSEFRTKSECAENVMRIQKELTKLSGSDIDAHKVHNYKDTLKLYEKELTRWTQGAVTECNSFAALREQYEAGRFILAYYGDRRRIEVNISKNIEKVDLKPVYTISDSPSADLVKYMVNLKATHAFTSDNLRKQEIDSWFTRFETVLRRIYDDESLNLLFDPETFKFTIHIDGREPFDFNTMSMGYAAVFDIIGDLMMRMEAQATHEYNLSGVVLIDEIETHLHVELQKNIIPILTGIFPNLQFILTTHSPFVLSSAENAVIYDLETRTLVEDGLSKLPYEGIVEGYFGVDRLSHELREKFDRYKQLAQKPELSNEEYAEISELEQYLDEIPDYLAIDISAEYHRLKQELDHKEQANG